MYGVPPVEACFNGFGEILKIISREYCYFNKNADEYS
jgi:hypothetical protein